MFHDLEYLKTLRLQSYIWNPPPTPIPLYSERGEGLLAPLSFKSFDREFNNSSLYAWQKKHSFNNLMGLRASIVHCNAAWSMHASCFWSICTLYLVCGALSVIWMRRNQHHATLFTECHKMHIMVESRQQIAPTLSRMFSVVIDWLKILVSRRSFASWSLLNQWYARLNLLCHEV